MNINYILFSLVIVKFMIGNLFAQPSVPTSPVITPTAQTLPLQPASPISAPSVVAAPAQLNPPSPVAAPAASVSMPAAPAAMPSAPTMASSQASAVTPPPVAVSVNDKDFEEANKNLTETVAIKKVLKDLVKDINDKLLDARKKVLSAQKLSFDVLQKTQAEAEPLIAQATADLQSLQALQSSVQADLVPKFESNVKQVEELIKKIQDKMNELQAKGLKFQMSQTQPVVPLQPSQPQSQVGQSSTTLPQSASEPAIATQAATTTPAADQSQGSPFYNRAWDWTTDKVSAAGNFIKSSWKQFKHWAFKSESDDVKKNLKSRDGANQELKYQAPQTPEQVAISFDSIKAYFGLFENVAKEIELQFNKVYQEYLSLRLKISLLETTLDSCVEFRSYLESCELADPWWKRYIVQYVSNVLDVCVVFYAAAKRIVVGTYKFLFAGLIGTFISDVQLKMKEEDKQSEIKIEQKQMEPIK